MKKLEYAVMCRDMMTTSGGWFIIQFPSMVTQEDYEDCVELMDSLKRRLARRVVDKIPEPPTGQSEPNGICEGATVTAPSERRKEEA